MLASLNQFFLFTGRQDCRVKPLRLQRRLFREEDRELEREEYDRLLQTAQQEGRERLALLLETICATGIRVSEVAYITVEAARQGQAEIFLKGKVRLILLPQKLCRKLLRYAKKQKTVSGEVFLTKNGDFLFPQTDLGRNESPVPAGRGSAFQGISPQPATLVCQGLLSHHTGCGEAWRMYRAIPA